MAEFYECLNQKTKYYDKRNFNSQLEYDEAVAASSTVYVGNLEYEANQDSIKQLFGRAGKVKRIIMGINNEGSRCGFCFVIYDQHEEAERAVDYISQTKLGKNKIRVDLDPGYKEGREVGRGRDGNQKRDDFRKKNYEDRYKGRYNERYDNKRGERTYGRDRDRYQNKEHHDDDRYIRDGGPRHLNRPQAEQKSDEEY